jgi:hypothetical protein
MDKIYLQDLVNQFIKKKAFGRLQQIMVLLSVMSVKEKLRSEEESLILNDIAAKMVKNGTLLSEITHQIITQVRQKNLVNLFIHHVLMNLYTRANLVKDGAYISHFAQNGNPIFQDLPSPNLQLLRTFVSNSIWALEWQIQAANLQMLQPNFKNQETWASLKNLAGMAQVFLNSRNRPTIIKTLDYRRQCWDEIREKRRYQVPSKGWAEVMASNKLKQLFGLELIRFFQEGVKPPEVFLQFKFQHEERHSIGLLKIKNDGSTEGFHEVVTPNSLYQCIIEAVALSYYRDLVTPGEFSYYKSGRGAPKTRSSGPSPPRTLPRTQGVPIYTEGTTRLRQRRTFRLAEWYYAQEWARHNVTGHIRWVDKYFTAGSKKRKQAQKAGVHLPQGYTWVVEHERGGPERGELIL